MTSVQVRGGKAEGSRLERWLVRWFGIWLFGFGVGSVWVFMGSFGVFNGMKGLFYSLVFALLVF